MTSAQRRLVLAAVVVLALEIVATILAVAVNLPAQFGDVGTDAGEEWASRGTAISPPLVPLVVLGVAALLVRTGRGALAVAGAVLIAILGVLFAIGSVGEAVADGTPDVGKGVLVASGITGVVIGVVLVALALAVLRERRGLDA